MPRRLIELPLLRRLKPGLHVHDEEALNAEPPLDLLDEAITPVDAFFIRNNGALPDIADESAWTLTIDGEVERRTVWTLPELKDAFETVTVTAVLECAGNGRSQFSPATDGLQWRLGAVGCARRVGLTKRGALTGLEFSSTRALLSAHCEMICVVSFGSVRTGSRLTQIRFRKGRAQLAEAELSALHEAETLVAAEMPNISGGGIALSVDLSGGPDRLIGYRGKHHTGVVDVDRRAAHDVLDFWEPIHDRGARELVLDPDEFYILVSREAVHVPPLYAAEMTPFDPLVGEFRVHYAGFFDPGFGHSAAGGSGSRAVLEVRSHEVPFILEHGQIVGRLVYEHMLHRPHALYGTDLGSNYQAQGLKLSKHFR